MSTDTQLLSSAVKNGAGYHRISDEPLAELAQWFDNIEFFRRRSQVNVIENLSDFISRSRIGNSPGSGENPSRGFSSV